MVTVVGISPNVLKEIVDGYLKDRHLGAIYEVLLARAKKRNDAEDAMDRAVEANNNELIALGNIIADDDTDGLVRYQGFHAKYCHGHLLMFITDPIDQHHRLCIPQACHQKFFDAVHDQSTHDGYHKCYQRLRPTYYIPNMPRLLRKYIGECPTCALNSTTYHKKHGELNPIKGSLPFEFIAVDFVFKLPTSEFDNNVYDGFMSCTDIVTKMITLIPGRETYSAKDWARAFFYTYCRRWGVPNKILSDRGRIFLSEFCTILFRMMRTDLLVTTAYHPQGDGQSERTNQTIEVALRHLVNASKTDWAEHLAEIEFNINNTVNASTKLSPMQFLTGMNACAIETVGLPQHPQSIRTWSERREQI